MILIEENPQWWEKIKKDPRFTGTIKDVEKMTPAERVNVLKTYEEGDKLTRDDLEDVVQVIALFRALTLEKDKKIS